MISTNPQEIATKIFNLELQLESTCTLSVLNALVELYKEAIEYYGEHNSSLCLGYQERLHRILMQPKVLKLMKADNSIEKVGKVRTRERGKTHPAVLLQASKLISEESGKNNEKNKNTANRVVGNQIKRTENVVNKALNDLKRQEGNLHERLLKRKLTFSSISSENSFRSNISAKSPNYSLPQSPLSGISQSFFDFDGEKSPRGNFEAFHEQIEKIIEENFNEKTEKITQIKVKYARIHDLETVGNSSELNEINKSLALEIEEVSKELNDKRKELINNVKKT